MKSLIPYIVFPGTCKNALEFYAEVLNGEITSMTTFSDSPLDVPEEFGSRLFDSEFVASDIRFKASDDLPNFPVKSGVSLFVAFSDSNEREEAFNGLSEGGKIQFPLDDNFEMLTDKYGIQWMLVPAR